MGRRRARTSTVASAATGTVAGVAGATLVLCPHLPWQVLSCQREPLPTYPRGVEKGGPPQWDTSPYPVTRYTPRPCDRPF